MSTANKILIVAIIALAIAMAWLGDHIAQLQKERRLYNEMLRLETELSDCRIKERGAANAVERQNAAIEAVRVDTVVIEKRVNRVIDKYSYIRETVRLSVEKDGTCENTVNNIDFVLRRYGAELRPANGN